jgi:hypothetical protein
MRWLLVLLVLGGCTYYDAVIGNVVAYDIVYEDIHYEFDAVGLKLYFPVTSEDPIRTTHVFTLSIDGIGEYITTLHQGEGTFIVPVRDVHHLRRFYSEGSVPYTLRLEKGIVTVLEKEGVIKLPAVVYNETYNITIVQFVPPNISLANLFICDHNYSIDLHNSAIIPSIQPQCDGRSIQSFVKGGTNTFDTVGHYWEKLLSAHRLTNRETKLGMNPRFTVSVQEPVVIDFNATNETDIMAMVPESSSDYTIYLFYKPARATFNETDQFHITRTFDRAFAYGTKSYVPIFLDQKRSFVSNDYFLTIVHELGHQLFNADDLYNATRARVPEGVHNATHACIMSLAFEAAQRVSPDHVVLCAETVTSITWGMDNPSCFLDNPHTPQPYDGEFYAGRCADCTDGCVPCTSLNYVDCSRP